MAGDARRNKREGNSFWDDHEGNYQRRRNLQLSYLALAGGIIAIIGALGAIAGPRKLAILLLIGGILAIVGAVHAFGEIETGAITETFGRQHVSATASYGLYLSLVGGILALTGTLGARGE